MIAPPFESLGQLHDHLLVLASETEFPPGRRVQLSVASFAIVRDHHLAIAVLLDAGLCASAFALMRALFEAAVKGMWFSYCASDGKLEAYASRDELPQVGELVADLLETQLPPLLASHFRRIKKSYWKVMSSFAHAGHAQVRHWLAPKGVQAAYTPAEIDELVTFTAFVAVAAALERERLGVNGGSMARIESLLPAAAPE